MIAPEGIRDGRYYAEALYTFAGEGVEDLPFKKGKRDLIEVLDCADANWWRGKILDSNEDGLFPACLVKFTEAPVAQEAMKTAERLARLSDVLTPAYAKQQQSGLGSANGKSAKDPNASDSIESLLLNLANNEMQVQQQKIQAHMPQKPMRMKLLYEDHTQPESSIGRSSSVVAGNFKDAAQKQPPRAKAQLSPHDLSLSQAGLWAPPPPTSRTSTARSNGPVSYNSSFTSSMESMREATLRTEEATKNRSSGSMLFGPRGMPNASSRSSSRALDDMPPKSEQSTMRSTYSANSSQEALGRQVSFTSLYSLSDVTGTVSSSHKASARTAHEAAISEVRQMMDGIPSPVEQGARPLAHEADYLFDDDDDDEDGAKYAAVDTTKFQAMMSPSSENSARFVSYASTVSSQVSSVAESTKSKRLPTVPFSASASMASDASSLGLAGLNHNSVGDLNQLHRSWYSSTESLNLAGGGLKSEEDDTDIDDTAFASTTAHERPQAKRTVSVGNDSNTVNAQIGQQQQQQQYSGNYDTRYDIATDFQRMMNVSSTDTSNYYGGSGPSMRAASSTVTDMPLDSNPSRAGSQAQPLPQASATLAYYQQPVYDSYQQQQQPQQMLVGMASNNGQAAYHMNGGYIAHPRYAVPAYSGVDPNGHPYSAYQQPYYSQQASGVAAGGMATAAPFSMAPAAGYTMPPEQVHSGYYEHAYMVQQQQPQQPVVSLSTGQPLYRSQQGPHPANMTPAQLSHSMGYAPVAPVPAAPAPVAAPVQNLPVANDVMRQRSYTAGAQQLSESYSNGTPSYKSHVRQSASTAGQQQQQLEHGAGVPIPGQRDHTLSGGASGMQQRPASFAGNATGGSYGRQGGGPLEADQSLRIATPALSGFGTVSSTPPATLAQKDRGMSPFPSNVGPSQIGTPSATNSAGGSATEQDMIARDVFIEDIDPVLLQPLPANVTPINFVKMARPVFKFGGHISHPDTVNWSKVDRQMATIKSLSVKLTVDVLATMHIGRPFGTAVEQARAAFIWVASNIQYDPSGAESNDDFEQQEAPNAVLQRRRSRGPGFAYLFDAMMSALGIESHTVRGYLRQPLDTYQGAVMPAANHVWNSVCIDGEYRLVDTACAAKSHPLNAESKTDSWFFMASPKDMLFTHYPVAAANQFVDPVVPLSVFWMLPYVRPTYFQAKVKLLNLPHVPRLELRDDQVTPLVLCVRDSTLSAFAEVELHDPSGSGRIVARQPLLAQCMDYKGKRMVKVLVGVRGADARGLIKIYCGTRLPLQPKRPGEGTTLPPGKAQKMLGFLQAAKDKRSLAHDYTRVKDVDEEGCIKTVATAKTFPLACVLPVVHQGRNNAPTFVQPNAAIQNEFYIKEPTDGQLHLGESISFHLLPVGDERLFHLQLRSPSGQQHKFIYQPSDQGYILRHTVKERGAWIIVYHTDTDGWLPIVSYHCI
ncbi:hypothetical protein GGI20_003644 [Coemansia sp. BCRC 34301]|nr:hypothetical protein GGI20_003644 [Coemansia sp. BCRC 34301]